MTKTAMRKKFFVGLSISALLLTTVFSPTASAASSFSTEANVKKALYALAAYDCISSSLLQDTAIGNKYDSIINDAEYSKVYIGQWLGDANGMITCKDALTKTLGTGNITEAMLGSDKIFNGVYEKSSTGEQKIRCNYGIVNSSGNATMDGVFSWPQGYFDDVNGDRQDRRTHGVIEVVFNEDGPVRLEGATSDIDVSHTLESMKEYSINWSKPEKICRPLVMYTEVYPGGQFEDAFGETMMSYEPVLGTDDGTPFNEWGIHVDDRYHAWLHSNSEKFTHTVSPVTSSTQLKLKDNAQTKLLSNLAAIYLGGATNATDFLNANADAKYILYGRYLFNGDGNGGFACGGITVATDDPNFNDLKSTDYWDTSQPYIASVSAYKNGSASSKTSYRTKFGGDGLLTPGSVKNVNFPGVVGDCKTLAGQFNSINPSANSAKTAVSKYMKVGTVEELPPENTTNDDSGEDSGGGTPCSVAAASLGWIICPVIQGVGNSVSSIYDMIEESFLRVDADFVSQDSATYTTWQRFQSFANIAFAIVLLVIILSQITGFGVNNYGIKKILPSLIIVAVLVNLSFFICQIAVDLSNILGYELRERFLEFASNIAIEPDFTDGSAGSIVGYIVSTIVSAGALTGIGIVLFSNLGAWIWPFLLSLLVVAIGVLFFFIILGVRQTGIIILIVLSPVAIVCYALPNTKGFFDRWRKMLTSLLVVYPICGLMMGGGQFVSRLLLSNIGSGGNVAMSSIFSLGVVDSGISSFFYVLVAMLIQVVPFFFIPSIVKSSMAAMGNLGAKLSNFGRGLGRAATGTIRRSDGYKNRVARGRAWDAKRALNRSESTTGLRGLTNRVGARMRSGNNRVSRAMNKSYTRRQADRINAIAAQRDADRRAQMTVDGGLAGAERRQNEELRKFHANTYSGDRAFMSDFDAQEAEYERALDAVDSDPTNEAEVARLRALQDVIGSTPDGQDRIQRVLNRRLYKEQEAARLGGRPPVLSAGMQAAKETLMSDHGGFKSGNRGLAATLKDMNASGDVFKNGTFAKTGKDAKGDDIYGNAYYGAQAAKGSAYELANANDDTLKNMYDSIGSMSMQQLMDTYRNASEAITNDTIAIKPENEAMLNKIRQEAWNQIQASTSSSPDYYDDQGRLFEHNVGSFYNYTDNNGTVHRYKRDASTGDFKEMGGAGEVVSGGQMMSASDNFTSQYGSNYRELHAGDTYKIDHRQYAHATMPTGWHQRKDGNWYNGNTRLTPDEVARAEEIRRYNNQVDIHNGT